MDKKEARPDGRAPETAGSQAGRYITTTFAPTLTRL